MRKRIILSGLILVLTIGWNLNEILPQESAKPAADDAARISSLIQKLGSDDYRLREQAAQDLEKLGSAALTPLRQATRSKVTEISRRAAKLLEQMEEKILLETLLTPKRLRLNVKDASVAETVAELARVSGYTIELADKTIDRKVTLDTGDVTFWEAMRQLCNQAELVERTTVAPAVGGGPMRFPVIGKKGVQPVVPVMPAVIKPSPVVLVNGKPADVPVSVTGSVRVRTLPRAPGAPALAQGETEIEIEVAAEPRLKEFGVAGSPRILKVVDDQGQNLTLLSAPVVAPPNRGNGVNINGINVAGGGIVVINGVVMNSAGMGNQAPPSRTVKLRFKTGEKATRSLQELTGSVLVQATQENEPLVTVENILKAAGQTAKGKKEYSLEVQAVEKLADGSIKIQVTMENPSPPNPFAGMGGMGRIIINGVDITANQPGTAPSYPKLIDVKGTAYAPVEAPPLTPTFRAGRTMYSATLVYRPQSEAAQLVLYGSLPVTFSVPFALKNIPLP